MTPTFTGASLSIHAFALETSASKSATSNRGR
jgi:hypothetical protein